MAALLLKPTDAAKALNISARKLYSLTATTEQRRPIGEHVVDYLAELISRQNTAKHVRMTIKHIETIIEHCEAETITDLTSAAVRQALHAIRQTGNLRIKRKSDRKLTSLRT